MAQTSSDNSNTGVIIGVLIALLVIVGAYYMYNRPSTSMSTYDNTAATTMAPADNTATAPPPATNPPQAPTPAQ